MCTTFEEWAEKYPKHCKECFGLGETNWVENHGDSYHEPASDFCICIYDNQCPRCGGLLEIPSNAFDSYAEVTENSCGFCGWDWNNGISDSFWPDEPEFDLDF
jgi:hypothetical protein